MTPQASKELVRERVHVECPQDCDIEWTIRTEAAVVPASLEAPPVDQEPRPAVTPEDVMDGYPECPGCGAEMEMEWDA